jgi:hypothetical protein
VTTDATLAGGSGAWFGAGHRLPGLFTTGPTWADCARGRSSAPSGARPSGSSPTTRCRDAATSPPTARSSPRAMTSWSPGGAGADVAAARPVGLKTQGQVFATPNCGVAKRLDLFDGAGGARCEGEGYRESYDFNHS